MDIISSYVPKLKNKNSNVRKIYFYIKNSIVQGKHFKGNIDNLNSSKIMTSFVNDFKDEKIVRPDSNKMLYFLIIVDKKGTADFFNGHIWQKISNKNVKFNFNYSH